MARARDRRDPGSRASARDDARPVVVRLRLAGTAREVGQLGKRDVHAEGPGPDLRPVKRRADPARRPFRHQVAEQQFRRDIGRHGARGDSLAGMRGERRLPCHARDHAATRRWCGRQHRAPRLPRHGLRDRAHAADRMAPHALLAVHLAEAVVQQDVGGPGREGARVMPTMPSKANAPSPPRFRTTARDSPPRSW